MKTLVSALLLVLARGGDLRDTLEAQSTADGDVSEEAACWCNKLKDTLNSRSRETESQLQYMRNEQSRRHFENEALRSEVAGHEAEAEEHQQSLDSGASINSKAHASYEEEKGFHESALKSVRKAMEVIPDGSGGEVMGALRGLEQTFSDKMEDAQAQHESRDQGLLDSKAEMLRLAKSAAATKSKRLSDGVAAVAQAKARVSLYDEQSSADASLGTSVENLCTSLTTDREMRERLWQDAILAYSQAEAEKASALATKSMSRLAFFKRTSKFSSDKSNLRATLSSEGHAAHTMKDDSDLESFMSRSKVVQAKIIQMLGVVLSDVRLVDQSSNADEHLKRAVEELCKTAAANAEPLPSLFEAVRSVGQRSMTIDKKIAAEMSTE